MFMKTVNFDDCQIKLDDAGGSFEGYAAVFGGVDSYGDTIVKGAFASSLRGQKPKMFFNHAGWDLPIGKWVKAKEDDHGLYVVGELTPGNQQADGVRAALKHGTLDGLSIGFYLKKGDYDESETGRTIKKVSKLVEVSVVTFPADSAARVDLASVKSAADSWRQLNECESFLREVGGFSREAAKMILSRAKVLMNQREADPMEEAKEESPEEQQLATAMLLLLPQRLRA
jgi:HK97 family phage prohead protease